MNRLDYYALLWTLLVTWLILLYFDQEMYWGMFIGSFFTTLKTITNFKNTDIWEPLEDIIEKDILEIKSR